MAPTLPKPVVAAIETAIQIAHNQGKAPDMVTIATIFNTTYESVARIHRRLRKFEATGIDDRKRPGPKPLQNQDERDIARFIRGLLEERPELDQKTVGKEIEGKYGTSFGRSTISRLMKKNGIPHKRTNQFYRKTKIVSTHPDGYVMPLERATQETRNVDDQFAGLSAVASVTEYSSPYALFSQGIECGANQASNLEPLRGYG
ncbi:hypothetical protein EG329_008398 [Mollisiaceae sp. DMI_Dod_QoI]|nr:hypothetical protein EG329_008398 [Helotiales sp. DMI_Dod_QoI]